jgi:adenylate cyclase
MANRPKEAITSYTKSIRLNPLPPSFYLFGLGLSYSLDGQYEKGIEWCEKAVRENPGDFFARIILTAVYSMAGRDEEARAEGIEALRINPKYSLAKAEKRAKYKYKDKMFAALRKAGLPENPPLPLPDKPSIAVLAFDNLSGDPEKDYFSDGIAEDIITALSKTPKMFVIARNSSFTYKGKPVKVQEVGRDLGVRYVLEGSVRKAGTKVRITAQLVDAKTGHHLWAESYDREQKDIFALQDDITKRIITELQVELTEGEQARLHSKGTDNLKAYLITLEARKLFRRHNLEDNYKARQLLEDAIEIDSQYADLYYLLALTHYNESYWAPKSAKDSIRKAIELSNKAISLNNSLSEAYSLLGSILIRKKQHEAGLKKLEEAAELCPNGANVHALLAFGLAMADKTEEAILISKKAMRLNPIPPSWYLLHRTMMYRNIGNYNEALVWAEKTVKVEPKNFVGRLNLCSVYSLTGRMAEARIQANEAMKLNPKFSLKWFDKALPYKNPEVKKRYIEALRNAGLPG